MKNLSTKVKNKKVNKLNFNTMKTKIQIMAVCLLSLIMITSCSHEDDIMRTTETQQTPSSNVASKTTTATYGVTPSGYTPNSSSSITLPGNGECGSFDGGVIKASVSQIGSNQFRVIIYKQNNTSFGIGGTAYVKRASVCGSEYFSTSYSSGVSTITIDITTTFPTGVSHYYPVIISSSGGTRYYAEPFMLYTLPSFISHLNETYYNGKIIGAVNGINIKASGPTNQASQSGGSIYQCVEFVKRYYSSIYGISFLSWGTAYNGYYVSQSDLEEFNNNNTKANGEPRPGDLIFFSGKTSAYSAGHVGIITEVSYNEVKVAHQNGGTNYPIIGWTLSRPSSKSINGTTIYNVLGWKRKKY